MQICGLFEIPTAHKMNEGITLKVRFLCRWRHLPPPPPDHNDSWTVTLTGFSIYILYAHPNFLGNLHALSQKRVI